MKTSLDHKPSWGDNGSPEEKITDPRVRPKGVLRPTVERVGALSEAPRIG
jgi:hypothetical protein